MKREAYKEMAAINQLSKQIKSANKRANGYEAKRAMYESRMMKAIEKASKETDEDIDVDNYREMLEQSNFYLFFAIDNNKEHRRKYQEVSERAEECRSFNRSAERDAVTNVNKNNSHGNKERRRDSSL